MRCFEAFVGRHCRRLPPCVLLMLGVLCLAHQSRAQSPQAIASYELGVFLDEQRHDIYGNGTITLYNYSARALTELSFHLYLNAFEDEETVFYRSPFSRARGGSLPTRWGGVSVQSLRVTGTSDELWPSASPHSPGDERDATSITVPLPEPLLPGDVQSLDIVWTSRLPDLVDRTGFKRDFHFAGQWFPKLAKLESDGFWAEFTFHPHGEFYADFGDYDVVLDVPCDHVVGATGVRVARNELGGRCRHHYQAQNVHDFAWTAWPGFEEHRRTLQGIDVTVLAPPGNDHNVAATVTALEHGLRFYGEHFGRYPYGTLTVVHPPEFAPAAGGMEYPTLITTGGAWYSAWLSHAVEQVTLHELGHQWFYGLVASHEQRWPFLDEGLTSYADSLALDALFGSGSGSSLFGWDISASAYYRVLGLHRGHDVAIAREAREFPSFGHLGSIVYGRTATALRTWERAFGLAPGELISDYARQHRFGHPTPDDLLASIGERLDEHAVEQLRIALLERGWVDYAVTEVRSEVQTSTTGGSPSSARDAAASETSSSSPQAAVTLYVGRALVIRRGNLQLPVEIELTDAAGQVTRQHWNGRDEYFEARHSGSEPLVAARVDPELNLLLDENLSNNARTTHPESGSRTYGVLTLLAEVVLHGLLP